MMYSTGRRSTDTESMTSETSVATSRVTTIPDSSSDTNLGPQQTTNRSHQIFIPRTEDDRSSTPSTISTVISQKFEGLKTNDNHLNKVIPQSPQQQQPWVNPYWGSKTNDNQVIPQNQQQQQPWVNPYWGSKTNDNQVIPQNQQQQDTWVNPYWSKPNQTDSQSIQKDQQLKNEKPQISTASNQQENKTWENPYWKDKNIPNQDTTVAVWKKPTSHEKALQVPPFYELIYPKHTPLSSSVSVVNSKNETISPSKLSTQNVNGYDNLSLAIDSQGAGHYQPLPTSTNTVSSSTNSQHPVLPLHTSNSAPFLQTTNVVSTPKTATLALVSQTTSLAASSFSNNTASPPSMNLAKYPLSASSRAALTEEEYEAVQHALHLLETNPNAIRVVQSSTQMPLPNISSQSPLVGLFTGNRPQQSQQQQPPSSNTGLHSNLPSPAAALLPGNQQQPPSTTSYPKNPSSPLATLFSGNQQQQSQQQPPPSNTSYPNNPPPAMTALFSGNPLQQPQQQQPPSNISYPNNPPPSTAVLFSGNPLQQPQQPPPPIPAATYPKNPSSPLAAVFSGNQQQQPPPSNAGLHNNISSPIAGLFSGNQQQQPPPSTTSYPKNSSSPLAGFFSGNRQQPPPSNTRHQTRPPSPLSLLYFRQEPQRQSATTSSSFSQNVQFNYPSYRHSLNSPQSYPSNISENIRNLTAPGSVVLI